MPTDRIANIVMLLAGPLANLLLWLVFSTASDWMRQVGDGRPDRMTFLLTQLGRVNFLLFVFNLMPAHPLDGGRTLVQIASKFIGYDSAMRVVAYLGLLVAVWLVLLAFGGQIFAALVAFVLFQANIDVLQRHGGPRWKRWN
jgi:stage IV sporulation protein FB